MNRFILALILLGTMGSGCLSSNPAAPGAPGGFAADPAGSSTATARPDEVEAQVKSYPGSVAAPTPDPVGELKDAAKGTQEVICRSEDPALFQVRFKGQVFEAPKSGNSEDLAPCLDCAGKILRVVIEEGADDRFVDEKIKEEGTFELTFMAPDPHAVGLHVMPAMDPYLWSQSPEEKGTCPKGACTQNFVMKLKNLLEFEEGSIETAPICSAPLKIFKKMEPPVSF